MRRGVLAACLIGCASPSSGIHGKLLVHTGDPTPYTSVHVLLGDGTQYDIAVDGNGDALFEDTAIRGQQDVTVAWVQPGLADLQTARAIDRDEVWLSFAWFSAKRTLLRSLTGHVLGGSGASKIEVDAVGATLAGSATAQANGSFSMPLMGTAQGTFDLAAHAHDAQGQLLAAGLVRGLSSTMTTTADITLDHAADQSRQIDVSGADAYGAATFDFYLDHYIDGLDLFSSTITTTVPTATLTTIDATSPFNALQRTASGLVCNSGPRLECGIVSMPFESSSRTLDLLPPPMISPTFDTGPQGTPIPLAGLDFLVTADPSVQYVNLELWQSNASNQVLDWVISMPTAQVEFAPFALPSDATPQALQPGTLEAFVYAQTDDRMTSYNELWAAEPFVPNFSKDVFRQTFSPGGLTLQ